MANKIDNSLNGSRSKCNTSCNWTGSAEFGRIVPFHVEELDPSVKIEKCVPKVELQMLPLASPTFGKLDVYIHYFFCPTRLIWNAAPNVFERQGPLKNSVVPYVTLKEFASWYQNFDSNTRRPIFKHLTSMGLPPFFDSATYVADGIASNDKKLSLLPLRAYQRIWWDFYRDPEVLRDDVIGNFLLDSSGHVTLSGSDNAAARTFIPRVRSIKDCWIANLFASNGQDFINPVPVANSQLNGRLWSDSSSWVNIQKTGNSGNISLSSGTSGSPSDIIGELSPIDIRKIEALTRFAERLSLGGKRAIDAMYAAYGVKPDFLKLQMCQYLGGAKESIMVSDITSSADTTNINYGEGSSYNGSPLGAKAATGYCKFSNLDINFTAPEHGYLIGVISVMPQVHFVQGFNKIWFRNNVDDFFSKHLERTGQVAVPKIEVAASYASHSGGTYNTSPAYARGDDDLTFAFDQPYYELKRGQDILAGDFMDYHRNNNTDADGDLDIQNSYMHSMEMYLDFPASRTFNADNLSLNSYVSQFNKIFYYQGGYNIYSDSDDHIHLCIDKEVLKDTPYDNYAIPTLETTENPHASKSSVGEDVVL